MTYRAHLFLNQLEAGLAKFEILEPYVSPRKLGNKKWRGTPWWPVIVGRARHGPDKED